MIETCATPGAGGVTTLAVIARWDVTAVFACRGGTVMTTETGTAHGAMIDTADGCPTAGIVTTLATRA